MPADRPASDGVRRLWSVGQATGSRASAMWPAIGEPGDRTPQPAAELGAPSDPPPLRFDEADLARATAAVAAESRALARQAVEAEAAARQAAALEAIVARLQLFDEALAQRTRQFREAAVALAALATETVGRGAGGGQSARLATQLAAQLAEALTRDCLRRFDPNLALTVEVAPALADPLAATLRGLPALQSRPGRIAVEAVAGLEPGEARLVWADGEADWSTRRLHDAGAAVIRRLTEPADASSTPNQGAATA